MYKNKTMGAAFSIDIIMLLSCLLFVQSAAATTIITANTTATATGCTDCEVTGNSTPFYTLNLPSLSAAAAANTTNLSVTFSTITLGGLMATSSGVLLIEGFFFGGAANFTSVGHGPMITISISDVVLLNGRIEVSGALPPRTTLTIRSATATGAYVWPIHSEGLVVLRDVLLQDNSVFEIAASVFTVVRETAVDDAGLGAPITAHGNVTVRGNSQLRIVSNRFNLLRAALADRDTDLLAAIDLSRTFIVLSAGGVLNISANTFGADVSPADARRTFPTSFLVLFYSMRLDGTNTTFAIDGNDAQNLVAHNTGYAFTVTRFSLLDNSVGVPTGATMTLTGGSTLSVRRNTIVAAAYFSGMCLVVNVQSHVITIDSASVHFSENAVPNGGNAVMIFAARGLLTLRNGALVAVERNRLDNPLFRYVLNNNPSLEGLLGNALISNAKVLVAGNAFRNIVHTTAVVNVWMLVLQTLVNASVRIEENTVENMAYAIVPIIGTQFQSSALVDADSVIVVARNTALQRPIEDLFGNANGLGAWLRIRVVTGVTFQDHSALSIVDNAAIRKSDADWPNTMRWVSSGIVIDNGNGGRGNMFLSRYSMVNISNNSFQHSRLAILVKQLLTLTEGSQFLVTNNTQHSGGRTTSGYSDYWLIGFYLHSNIIILTDGSSLIVADNTFFFAPSADRIGKLLGAVITCEQKLVASNGSVVAFERNIVSSTNTTTKYAVGVGLDPIETTPLSHTFQTAEEGPNLATFSIGVLFTGRSELRVTDNAVQMNPFTEDTYEHRFTAVGVSGGPTAIASKSSLVVLRNSLTIGTLFTDPDINVLVTGVDIPSVLWVSGASQLAVAENDIAAYAGTPFSWVGLMLCAVCPRDAGGLIADRHYRAQSVEEGDLQAQVRARVGYPLFPYISSDGSHFIEGRSIVNISQNRFTPHFDDADFSSGIRVARFLQLRGSLLAASNSTYTINHNVVGGHVENAPSGPEFPHPHTNQSADGIGLIRVLKSMGGCSGIAATVGSTISFHHNAAYLNYSTPGRPSSPSQTTFLVAISASYIAADNQSTISVSDNFLHVEMIVSGSQSVTLSGVRADVSVCSNSGPGSTPFMFVLVRGASTLALRNNSFSLLNRDPAALSDGLFGTAGTSFIGLDTNHNSRKGNIYVIGDGSLVDLSMNHVRIHRLVIKQQTIDAAMVGMTAQKIDVLSGGTIRFANNRIDLDMPFFYPRFYSYTRGIAICSVDYAQNNEDRLFLEDRGTLHVTDNDIRMVGHLNAVALVVGRCLRSSGSAASPPAPPSLPTPYIFNPFVGTFVSANAVQNGFVISNASAVRVAAATIVLEGTMKAAIGAVLGAFSDRVYVEDESTMQITHTDINATVRVTAGVVDDARVGSSVRSLPTF